MEEMAAADLTMLGSMLNLGLTERLNNLASGNFVNT